MDASGQRTSVATNGTVFPAIPSWLWGYDSLGQVTTVGTTTTKMLYDAHSRRIAVTTGGTSTIFVQGSAGVSPALNKTRLWGTDLSSSLQGAGEVGGMLAERQHSGTAATYHPTYDANGNVSEYLPANGTTAAHFEYDPFGNTVVNTDTSNQFTLRFSTKPRDSATGLYHYGYKYYDPVRGRWPSKDPIEENGEVNLYEFVGNAAIFRHDFLGMIAGGGASRTQCCGNRSFNSRGSERCCANRVVYNQSTACCKGGNVANKVAGHTVEGRTLKECVDAYLFNGQGGPRLPLMAGRCVGGGIGGVIGAIMGAGGTLPTGPGAAAGGIAGGGCGGALGYDNGENAIRSMAHTHCSEKICPN